MPPKTAKEAGKRKIPEPIMLPVTMAVAVQNPNGLSLSSILLLVWACCVVKLYSTIFLYWQLTSFGKGSKLLEIRQLIQQTANILPGSVSRSFNSRAAG